MATIKNIKNKLSHVQFFATPDCSLPGSSVHGIFQAIVLEWIAVSFCRGSSQPRDRTQQKTQKIKNASKNADNLETLHTHWECKMMWLLWKTVERFLKKLKIELPYNLTILLYVPKRIEDRIFRRYLHTHVHCNTIHNIQEVTELDNISVHWQMNG